MVFEKLYYYYKRSLFVTSFIVITGFSALAQNNSEAEAYNKVLNDRAQKIVNTLNVTKTKKIKNVQEVIVNQYKNLSELHDSRDKSVAAIKTQFADNKETQKIEIEKINETANVQIKKLHTSYLKKLGKHLNVTQIEGVKNGMTYNVVPNTYKAYQEMLPQLTQKQKTTILGYLTEARELAMDAETAKKKHEWFGKYKGRINNYLSAEGIDMKKQSLAWEAKIKEKEKTE